MTKALLKNIFLNIGGEKFLRNRNRTPRILFWHGVDINPDPVIEAEGISKDKFLKQLDYLQKHYEIISIDEFYGRYENDSFNGKEIVLTFDDGYKNNLTVLAPLLKDRKLPFTVFISTSNISTGGLFPTSILRLMVFGANLTELKIKTLDKSFLLQTEEQKKESYKILSKYLKESEIDVVEKICEDLLSNISKKELDSLLEKHSSLKPLTWDEVRELKQFDCTIGSHCIDHICCHSNQKEDEVKRQISDSKKIIESELNEPCNYFAYPNGNYTPFSNECVKEAGYLMGFSTKNTYINTKIDQYQAMPRISVPFGIDTFKIIINLYPKK
jgi:peptidoglycan/xylan/chitin deacetylase (PgdA/CDA1 family)